MTRKLVAVISSFTLLLLLAHSFNFNKSVKAEHTIKVGTTLDTSITFTSTLPVVSSSFSVSIIKGELIKLKCGGTGFTEVSSTSTSCVVTHTGGGTTSGTLATVTVKASSEGILEIVPEGTFSGLLGGLVSGELKGEQHIVETQSNPPTTVSPPTIPTGTSSQNKTEAGEQKVETVTSQDTSQVDAKETLKSAAIATRRRIFVSPSNFPTGKISLPDEDVELIFTTTSFKGVSGWQIIYPSKNIDVLFNLKALLKNASGIRNVLIPGTITIEKPIGGDVLTITIPKDTTLTDSSTTGLIAFDGTFSGPVTIEVLPGCQIGQSVDLAFEMGRQDRQIIFDQPVHMNFQNKSGQQANFCQDGQLSEAMEKCQGQFPADLKLGRNGACYLNNDGNLILATNHLTQIVLFDKKFPVWIWVAIGIGLGLLFFIGAILLRNLRLNSNTDEYFQAVVHDLKTPLAAIKDYIAMVAGGNFGKVGKNIQEPLATVAGSADRMTSMVNDILDVSRLKSGKLKLTVTDFNIDTLIDETVQSVASIAKEKKLIIASEQVEHVVVRADKERVRQILINLVGNALKFTQEGSINISSRDKGKLLEVLVSDTGTGISIKDREGLFKRFSQGGDGAAKKSGTGLGLYISKQLAQKMGGNVWLEKSTLGVGSVFGFSMPSV